MADAGIETFWLDNPPVNAIGPATVDALEAVLDGLPGGTRVLVLRGRGERAFSAGADIAGFRESDGGARALQRLADRIESAPVPVVAAVHGFCLGGGLELALACDLRIARRDAQLGFPEVRLGLLPGGGGTQRSPRLAGRGRAAWLIMSGERIGAEQAERWGLVELVVDDLDEGVDRVAGLLARQSGSALREIKELLHATRERRDFELESEAFARRLASEDGREGVAAFLEKREPRWVS
ncbi:MAG TPA: enoyl-CoA hydratase-related protein [Gaiellaceae bacterium]|nr:enoyl-CoA hydratase-related protein [Gaiellaceae bacterium]